MDAGKEIFPQNSNITQFICSNNKYTKAVQKFSQERQRMLLTQEFEDELPNNNTPQVMNSAIRIQTENFVSPNKTKASFRNHNNNSSYRSQQILISPRSTPKILSDCCFALSLAHRCIQDFTPFFNSSNQMTLQSLDISNNKIQKIPEQIFKLANLTILKLDNNLIKVLPDELFTSLQLESFSVANNLITNINQQIIQWKDRLITLNVSRNHISQLPEVVSQLTELRNLNIASNDFLTLPCSLVNLKKLQEFIFDWFKYCQPPLQEVCNIHNSLNGGYSILQELLSLFQRQLSVNGLNELTFKEFIENFSGGCCEFGISINDMPTSIQVYPTAKQPNQQSFLRSNISKGVIGNLFANKNQNNTNQEVSQNIIMQVGKTRFFSPQVYTPQIAIPSHSGRTLMHLAVQNEDVSVLRNLLQMAFHLSQVEDSDGHTPLSLSILDEKYYCSKIMIYHKVNVNRGGGMFGSCLTLGVTKFQYYLVRDLLKNGADTNKPTKDGNTALHFLFSNFQKDAREAEKIATLLLENGSDPNVLNNDNRAPIHLAARKGNVDAIKFAIEYNRKCYFNKNQGFRLELHGGPDKQTILHLAAANQYHEIVKLLLDNKFDVFASNADGRTPLSLSFRYFPLAKLLKLHKYEYINSKVLKNLKLFEEEQQQQQKIQNNIQQQQASNSNHQSQQQQQNKQSFLLRQPLIDKNLKSNSQLQSSQTIESVGQEGNVLQFHHNNISSDENLNEEIEEENLNIDLSMNDNPRLKNINDWNNLVPKLILNKDEPRQTAYNSGNNSLNLSKQSSLNQTDGKVNSVLPSTQNKIIELNNINNNNNQVQKNGVRIIQGNNNTVCKKNNFYFKQNPLTIENFNENHSESEIEQSFIEVEEGYQDRPNFILQQKFIPYSPNNLQKIQSLNTLMTKCLSPKANIIIKKENIQIQVNSNTSKSLHSTANQQKSNFRESFQQQQPKSQIFTTQQSLQMNTSSITGNKQIIGQRAQRQSMPIISINQINQQEQEQPLIKNNQKLIQQSLNFQPNTMYSLLKKYKFMIREAENIQNYKQIIINPNCLLSMRIHFLNQLQNIYNQVYVILGQILKQTVYQQMIRDSMVEEYLKLGDDNINTLLGTNKKLKDCITDVFSFLNQKNNYDNTILIELLISNLMLGSFNFQILEEKTNSLIGAYSYTQQQINLDYLEKQQYIAQMQQQGQYSARILTENDIEKLVPLEEEYDNANMDLNTIWMSYQNNKQRNNPLTNNNQNLVQNQLNL